MLEKPVVGVGETLTQPNRVAPAERVQAADIESLPRCSVGAAKCFIDSWIRTRTRRHRHENGDAIG